MKKRRRRDSLTRKVHRISGRKKVSSLTGKQEAIASDERSGPSVADPSIPAVTEAEAAIIDRFWDRLQKELLESQAYLRDVNAAAEVGELLAALGADFVRALENDRYLGTLRRMDRWDRILAKIRSSQWETPQCVQESIADILCAADLLSQHTIGVKPRRGRNEPTATTREDHDTEGNREHDSQAFDALDLHRIDAKQRSILRNRLRRPSVRFLKELEAYRSTLTQCAEDLLSENLVWGCRACIAVCDCLERTIKFAMTTEPARHGTRSMGLHSPTPENLAASLIIGLLRPHEAKKSSALPRCAHLLAIVWPEIGREFKDRSKEEALLNRLRSAYLRYVRPPSNPLC